MSDTTMHGFTTIELEALLRKTRDAALEEAAKVCDAVLNSDKSECWVVAGVCAERIRAMKGGER